MTSERERLLALAIISIVASSEGSTFIVTGTKTSVPMHLRPGLAFGFSLLLLPSGYARGLFSAVVYLLMHILLESRGYGQAVRRSGTSAPGIGDRWWARATLLTLTPHTCVQVLSSIWALDQ